jgi:DNA-binding NarL/FixJ family response regulator
MTTASRKSRDTVKKVLIVDDHPIVREGLALLANRERDLKVCGEASGAPDTVAAIQATDPDLVLMDISIRGVNGIELTKELRARFPNLKVLIISMHDEALYAERALKAGAQGYLMKQEAPEVVLRAIRKVLDGGVFISERISAQLMREMTDCKLADMGSIGVERLTNRELHVFELIGRGMTTQDIAAEMHISIKTVETHRVHIRQKMKLRNAVELTHRAIRWYESEGGNGR